MANIFQCLGVVVVCFAVSNCAVRPTVGLTSDLSLPERAFWNDERRPEVSQASVSRPVSVPQRTPAPRQASVPGESAPTTTGLASRSSNVSTGKPSRTSSGEGLFTPEWYASEKAEADRIKRFTNICQC